MISHCPHCENFLQFNEAQKEKLSAALANLTSGALKLGCPHCKKPIHLSADGTLAGETAIVGKKVEPTESACVGPIPPDYPDISWLVSGMYSDQDVVEDVPKALILITDDSAKNSVGEVLKDRGFQLEFPESAEDAISKMRFVSYSAVVLHSEFDGTLATSRFHKFMAEMPMRQRRSIYYILVGKEFHTLYDLEALAYSANVVVNESEIEHMDVILKKGLRDYDELFGPYLAAMEMNS